MEYTLYHLTVKRLTLPAAISCQNSLRLCWCFLPTFLSSCSDFVYFQLGWDLHRLFALLRIHGFNVFLHSSWSPVCAAYIQIGMELSTGLGLSYQGNTPKGNWRSLLQHPPTVNGSSEVEAPESLCSACRNVDWLDLVPVFCAHNQCHCEFMSATAVSCPKDTILL